MHRALTAPHRVCDRLPRRLSTSDHRFPKPAFRYRCSSTSDSAMWQPASAHIPPDLPASHNGVVSSNQAMRGAPGLPSWTSIKIHRFTYLTAPIPFDPNHIPPIRRIVGSCNCTLLSLAQTCSQSSSTVQPLTNEPGGSALTLSRTPDASSEMVPDATFRSGCSLRARCRERPFPTIARLAAGEHAVDVVRACSHRFLDEHRV
jgi:hypothetical protein